MRHPSEGDLRGDLPWVARLRGGEGAFAIGTADVPVSLADGATYQPRPNVICRSAFRFSWYALGGRSGGYRPLSVEIAPGPDLACALHGVWAMLEDHGEGLERLAREYGDLRFEVISSDEGPRLLLTAPLGERALHVLIGARVRYLLQHGDDLVELTSPDPRLDRAVPQLLAELAG